MIFITLRGGLGNQIFQYAAARSLAQNHHTKAILDTTWLDKKMDHGVMPRDFELNTFSLDASTELFNGALAQKIRHRFAHEYAEKNIQYDQSFECLPSNTKLIGNFQSERYFAEHANVIRKALHWRSVSRLKSDYINFASSRNSLAVHIRRGDYVTNKTASQILGALDLTYYRRAYRFLSQVRKIENVLVFSDDITWCKKHIDFIKKPIFVEGNLGGPEELRLMSKCNHHIIANSSFSWWGAWLAGSKDQMTVAPKKWFKDESLNSSDIIPSRWKTL